MVVDSVVRNFEVIVKLDAFQGPIREQEMMEIYLITGNYDMALDKIEYLLSIPSWLSPGILKIDPIFDNLRKLPGFKKIINSYQKEPEGKKGMS